MTTTFKIAAVQAQAGQIDGPVADLDWLETQTARAVGQGARLVLWPECSYPAYFLRSEKHYRETASRRLTYAKLLDRMAGTARKLGIYLAGGVVEERDDEKLSNAAVLFDPAGKLLRTYRKIFLWHFDHNYFVPGQEAAVIDTPLGRIGLMICADGRCPELAAIAAHQGAQLILNPTAWVSSARSPEALTNPQIEYFIPARAMENGCWILSANKVGVEADSIVYCGRSNLVDPTGRMVAALDSATAGVLVAEVDLSACRPAVLPPGDEEGTGSAIPRLAATRSLEEAEGSVPDAGELQGGSQASPSRKEERLSTPEYPRILFAPTGSLPVTRSRRAPEFQPPPRPAAQPADSLVLAALAGPLHRFDPSALLADLAAQSTSVVIAPARPGDENLHDAWVRTSNQFGMMLCFADQPQPGHGVTRLRLAGGRVDSFVPARAAMLGDAQVFVAAPTGDGSCPDLRLLRARAAENRIFVVASAADRAIVIAPTGAIVADSLTGRAMAVVARIVPGDVGDKQMAPGTDVVLGRDPELYARYLRANTR